MSNYNPFTEPNIELIKQDSYIIIPDFKKSKRVNYALSHESHKGLLNLANMYSNGSVSKLIEAIGLYELQVSHKDLENPEVNKFIQAGYEDAINNYNHKFLILYGSAKTNQEQLYMQGYLEGRSISTKI